MNIPTPEEIQRLRELEAKATKGPWFDSHNNINLLHTVSTKNPFSDRVHEDVVFEGARLSDREFLVELRNSASDLIRAAEIAGEMSEAWEAIRQHLPIAGSETRNNQWRKLDALAREVGG